MTDIFIGRSLIIEKIDAFVADTKNHILPIIAKGGAGKTWLLRNIHDKYLEPDVLKKLGISQKYVCSIWTDFSETRFHSVLNITLAWLEQLQEYVPTSDLTTYRTKVSQLATFSSTLKTSQEMQAAEKETLDFFLSVILKISSQRRILILLDTLEASSSSSLNEQAYQLISKMSNAVLILAGRPEAPLFKSLPKFKELYSHDWLIHPNIELKPFEPSDIQEYFVEALETDMGLDFSRQIKLLTAGNPVLVAITSEWLKNNIELPNDVKLPLTKTGSLVQGDLKRKQEKFEFELLSNIRKLQSPLDLIILYAAFLNRRSDPKIFELVIDVGNTDFDQAFEKFNKLVFVRKSLTSESGRLHDEAERLILKHVWPFADPDGEIRIELARTVTKQYYEPEIARLANEKRDRLSRDLEFSSLSYSQQTHQEIFKISEIEFQIPVLQAECLDYHFRISERDGWSYLEKLIQEATIESSNIQANFIEQSVYKLQLEDKNKLRTLLALSRIRLIQKNNEQADIFAEEARKLLLEKHAYDQDDIHDEAIITTILGMTEKKSIHQISLLEDAKEKAKMADNKPLAAKAIKELGLAFRKLGNWERSIEAYDAALDLLDQENHPDEYAAVLNNLAFVLLLDGKPYPADSKAEKALHIRKQRGNLHAMSLSYSTKGRIAEALRDYARAKRYFKQAADLALRKNDTDFFALCETNLASSEIMERNFDTARELVKSGMISKNAEFRARAFHQAAKIEFMQGKQAKKQGDNEWANALFEEARRYAKQASSIAHEIINYPLEAAIIYDLALIEYLHKDQESKYYISRLENILKNFDLKLEKGRLEELKGDIQFSSGAILDAFNFYIMACQILANYSPASFYDTFERIRTKFFDCPLDKQKDISSLIEKSIPDAHPQDLISALKQISNDRYIYSSGYLNQP